ncbi:MAG: FtsQ-type POTRA domain-containing protein [Clostridia bacterium]|nr:FtsQ-type POTRA domain-containing protein [Clostridia bacterium]
MTARRAFGLLAATLALIGAFLLLRSPALLVTHVQVSGLSELTAEQVVSEAAIRHQVPLWKIRAGDVAARLLEDPMIASVRVVKRWPDTLKIEIVERQPVAEVILPSGQVAEVDASGAVMRVGRGVDARLPLVTGAREDLRPRAIVQSAGLSRAVQVAAAARSFPEIDVAEIHIEADTSIVLYLADRTPVQLGLVPDAKRQLSVLSGLLSAMKQQGTQALYISVVDPDEPVVRPVDPQDDLPPPPAVDGG